MGVLSWPHNRKERIGDHKTCNVCLKLLPATPSFFNKESRPRKAPTDGLRGICIDCTKKRRNQNRAKWRREWKDLLHRKGMGFCTVCGYDKCFAALDYHHIDPKKKEIEPAKLFNMMPTEENFKRLNGCICLCANCHREYHYHEKLKEELGDGCSK